MDCNPRKTRPPRLSHQLRYCFPALAMTGVRVALSAYTTLGLGGPAGRLIEAVDDDELVALVRAADQAGNPLLVLGGAATSSSRMTASPAPSSTSPPQSGDVVTLSSAQCGFGYRTSMLKRAAAGLATGRYIVLDVTFGLGRSSPS
jgi:UDP-N-acetylenolpyruvoylglucosamine reductase